MIVTTRHRPTRRRHGVVLVVENPLLYVAETKFPGTAVSVSVCRVPAVVVVVVVVVWRVDGVNSSFATATKLATTNASRPSPP